MQTLRWLPELVSRIMVLSTSSRIGLESGSPLNFFHIPCSIKSAYQIYEKFKSEILRVEYAWVKESIKKAQAISTSSSLCLSIIFLT